jgi:hypothetical protein
LCLSLWFLRYSFATIFLDFRVQRGFSCGNVGRIPFLKNCRHPSCARFHPSFTKISIRGWIMNRRCLPLIAALVLTLPAFAQQNAAPPLYPAPGNPADAQSQQSVSAQDTPMPVFRVQVLERSARAVNYRNRGGSTMVDFKGTTLMPAITGKAKVDGKAGRLAIDVDLDHVGRPIGLGPQYLTYVLWAITPEGRAVNLGEILPGDNGKSKISVTTELQAFGLIVTAEPYFSVTHPSSPPKALRNPLTRSSMYSKVGSTPSTSPPTSCLPRRLNLACRSICSRLVMPS